MPPEIKKATKKSGDKKLMAEWEQRLQREGLGLLKEELDDPDSTPKKAAAAYAEARRFDPKLAKDLAAGYGVEGQHQDVIQAVANRFKISPSKAEELISDELETLNTDENASQIDLWRRFKNR